MAGAQLNSRLRAWLGAPARGDEHWQRALAAFGAAEAGLVAVEQALRGRTAAPAAAVAEHDARLAAMYEALRHLLLLPAPDRAALVRKMVLAEEHEVASLPGGKACVAAIWDDVRRLARH